MDVEMTTQAEMTFKCTSRSSKVEPIESQCMISYQQSIVTFAVSHTVFEKFDPKQSNDLEICPRSLTVVSSKSCRVAMYVKCSEASEGMKRKSPFSTPWATFLSLTVYGYLQIFEQFCLKAGDANPLVAEAETDFDAKWPFRVIQGHLFRYH